MRKTVATAASVVLLAAVGTTTAHAAPAAPTDVQIAWAGSKLHVSWDDGGEANSIRAEFAERWDGKAWRSVPVTRGKATMYVRAAGRGTTTYYRVAVPGMA